MLPPLLLASLSGGTMQGQRGIFDVGDHISDRGIQVDGGNHSVIPSEGAAESRGGGDGRGEISGRLAQPRVKIRCLSQPARISLARKNPSGPTISAAARGQLAHPRVVSSISAGGGSISGIGVGVGPRPASPPPHAGAGRGGHADDGRRRCGGNAGRA